MNRWIMAYTDTRVSTSPRRVVLHTESSLGLGGQEIRILTESRWLLEHGWDVVIAGEPPARRGLGGRSLRVQPHDAQRLRRRRRGHHAAADPPARYRHRPHAQLGG